MAKIPGSSPAKLFTPLGGSTRKYRNNETGEIISRYKYDKLYGSTVDYKGNTHAKAKANRLSNPELALARPAKGRKSTLKNKSISASAANLHSKSGEKFTDVVIKIHYKNDLPDFDRLASDFTAYINGLKTNKRIFTVVTALVFTANGERDVRNLIPARRWPTVQELGEALVNLSESYQFTGDETLNALSLHIIFSSAHTDSFLKIKPRRK